MQARRLLSTATNWEALINKASSPLAKAELSKLQAFYQKTLVESAASKGPVAPIDFASYRSRLANPKAVNNLEKAFTSIKYPESQLTTVQLQQEKLSELTNSAKAAAEASAARSKELGEQLAKLEAGRTDKDTTVDEAATLYPEIEREVKQEAKEEQWGKGIGL